MRPTRRSPRSSMRSWSGPVTPCPPPLGVTGRLRPRCGSPAVVLGAELVGRRHEPPPERAELPTGQPLGDRDRLRAERDEAGPQQVAGDEPADAVAHLLLVHEQLL